MTAVYHLGVEVQNPSVQNVCCEYQFILKTRDQTNMNLDFCSTMALSIGHSMKCNASNDSETKVFSKKAYFP